MSVGIDRAHSSRSSQGVDALRTVCITRCLTDTLTDRQAEAPTITALFRPPATLRVIPSAVPHARGRTDSSEVAPKACPVFPPSLSQTGLRDVGGAASPFVIKPFHVRAIQPIRQRALCPGSLPILRAQHTCPAVGPLGRARQRTNRSPYPTLELTAFAGRGMALPGRLPGKSDGQVTGAGPSSISTGKLKVVPGR